MNPLREDQKRVFEKEKKKKRKKGNKNYNINYQKEYHQSKKYKEANRITKAQKSMKENELFVNEFKGFDL